MHTMNVNGARLECVARGSGDPLLLIHGSIYDGLAPLLDEPRLGASYRVVGYHRRGFAGSDPARPPFSMAQQAADARAVLDQFGITRAHVAGHGYGGLIALQLTKDAPAVVATLALLEPAIVGPSVWAAIAQARSLYENGDKLGALDAVFTLTIGPDFQALLGRTLPPGVYEQACVDVDTYFRVEVQAAERWGFSAEDARRIRQPVLAVVGEDSPAAFREAHTLIGQWMPHAEQLTIPQANHAFPQINPPALAEGLARFLDGHRL